MNSTSTAKALIRVRGPEVTYGVLSLTPQVSSRAHSVDVQSFTIRRGNERYLLSDLPLARALYQEALNDAVYWTFECNEDERLHGFEIEFEIPDYGEAASIYIRAAERQDYPDMLFYEVEDPSGDWISLEDVLFVDLLPDSFIQILESSVVENLNSHTLDWLPMDSES